VTGQEEEQVSLDGVVSLQSLIVGTIFKYFFRVREIKKQKKDSKWCGMSLCRVVFSGGFWGGEEEENQ
jgi:hypothetical protein